MFIQTEETPNPNALKFFVEETKISDEPIHFSSTDESKGAVLVRNLFTIEGVEAVFLGSNFVTITKNEQTKWELMKPYIVSCLMDHFLSGRKALEGYKKSSELKDDSELSDIEKEIIEIIETRVRPSVALDGGDIIYKSFKEGIVYLELRGSCSGCPSSTITLKNGIESMLQYYVPEVVAVEAVEEE